MKTLKAGANVVGGSAVTRNSMPRKVLLICGILASLLYAATTILGAMSWAGYSSTSQHGVLTFLGVLFFLIAIGFGARAFGKRFRIYSIITLLVCVAFATLAGLDIPHMVANEPTPWMGVWERINIFSYLLWAVVLAIGLLRAPMERSQDGFEGRTQKPA